ncbi:hypothetical protein SFUMM280S_09468 [Streptomyces fumanus]
MVGGPVMTLALFGCALLLTACFFAWVQRRRMWFAALGAGTLYGYLLHGFLIKGGDYLGWFRPSRLHTPLGEVLVTVLAAAAVTLLCTAPVRRVFRFAWSRGWSGRSGGTRRSWRGNGSASTSGGTGSGGTAGRAGRRSPPRPAGPVRRRTAGPVPAGRGGRACGCYFSARRVRVGSSRAARRAGSALCARSASFTSRAPGVARIRPAYASGGSPGRLVTARTMSLVRRLSGASWSQRGVSASSSTVSCSQAAAIWSASPPRARTPSATARRCSA